MSYTSLKPKFMNRKSCRLFHRWKFLLDTGVTKYYQCRDCSARKAKQTLDGHQPIDREWLAGRPYLFNRTMQLPPDE